MGTTELAESHKGTCRHCPPVQSNLHWQAAWAWPASKNAKANVTIALISGPRVEAAFTSTMRVTPPTACICAKWNCQSSRQAVPPGISNANL